MAALRFLTALRGSGTEPALKRLRNRLLAVNIICLTLVVAAAFSIIYINFYNRTQNEIEKTISSIPRGVLENALLSHREATDGTVTLASVGVTPGVLIHGGAITIGGEARTPVDYSKAFVANISPTNDISVFSLLDLGNDDYVGAISAVLGANAPSGNVSIADRAWRYSFEDEDGNLPLGVFVPYKSSIVFLDIEDTNRGLGALALSLVIIGIVAVGAILFVSLIIANRAIRPVEESMARQRRFVADASHELKTPIAVIAANTEAAEAGGAGVAHWIGNISVETNRMGGLVENLLALAKAEEIQADIAAFDLIAAVCEEADRVEAFLFEKNVAFDFGLHTPPGEPLMIRSDRAKVQAALAVLFENAVKYTPEGGYVTVSVGRAGGKSGGVRGVKSGGIEGVRSGRVRGVKSGGIEGVISGRSGGLSSDGGGSMKSGGRSKRKQAVFVSVSNTGAYLPPEDVAHIFDRFYRTDRSRNSETGGHGIGLSIAKELARTLGGELTAISVPRSDGGAVNTFTLYI